MSVITEAISEKPANPTHIKDYCISQSLDIALSFDSTIILLSYMGILSMQTDKDSMVKKNSHNEKLSPRLVIELLLVKMVEDRSIQELFDPTAIKYDVISDKIAIRNSSVSLNLSGVKNLLISLGFFERSNFSENLLTLAPDYTSFFLEVILPAITPEDADHRTGMSIDELKDILAKKQLYGKIAEEFVFEFEKRRLVSHPKLERVKIISEIDCSAGYDIISFNDIQSQEIDRFIEVKSYSGSPQFYWSKNEVEEAQLRGENYFLYLVNRDNIQDKMYSPTIIQSPFRKVFLDESTWSREPQSWRFFLK